MSGISNPISTPVSVADGGTGLASGTSGGILGYTGTGTLASSVLLTLRGILLGGGAGATPTSLGAASNGQLPIGSTGANPVLAALTAGSNITITNAAGSITIAATAAASTAVIASTAFETSTRFSNSVVGSGTNTFNTSGLSQDTTTTISSGAKVIWTISNGGEVWLGSPTWSLMFQLNIIGTDLQTFGGLSNNLVLAGGGITYTGAHTGFKVVRVASGAVNLFATQADGTTENASASLTTLAENDDMDLFLKVNSTTSVDYYWRKNGGAQSAATNLTANMPTASVGSQANFILSNAGVATQTVALNTAVSYTR